MTAPCNGASRDSVVMIIDIFHSPKIFLLLKHSFRSKNKNVYSGQSGVRNIAGTLLMLHFVTYVGSQTGEV